MRYKEPTYFFRLKQVRPAGAGSTSRRNPQFIQPESRRNEVLSKLKAGVEDLSISRATLKWGIPLPHDPAHVLYVWIDALSNYITALGLRARRRSLFKKYWPADVHLIGKEILWFHTVYWPAMLLSLGIALPEAGLRPRLVDGRGPQDGQDAGELHRPGKAPRRDRRPTATMHCATTCCAPRRSAMTWTGRMRSSTSRSTNWPTSSGNCLEPHRAR